MNEADPSGSYSCGVMTESVTLRRGHARGSVSGVYHKYLVTMKADLVCMVGPVG